MSGDILPMHLPSPLQPPRPARAVRVQHDAVPLLSPRAASGAPAPARSFAQAAATEEKEQPLRVVQIDGLVSAPTYANTNAALRSPAQPEPALPDPAQPDLEVLATCSGTPDQLRNPWSLACSAYPPGVANTVRLWASPGTSWPLGWTARRYAHGLSTTEIELNGAPQAMNVWRVAADCSPVLSLSQVALKLSKHCKEWAPQLVTGLLLGLDIGSTLEVTHCFPMPVSPHSPSDPGCCICWLMPLLADSSAG